MICVLLTGLLAVACDASEQAALPYATMPATATSQPTSTPVPEPTSKLLPAETDTHRVVAKESARAPGLQGLVNAVESGDYDAVFAQVPYVIARCETILTREGNVCDFYGLKPGVDARWSMAKSIEPGRTTVARQEMELEKLVGGRPATLELIALQDDVRYYLIFALTPRSLTQTPLAIVIVYEPALPAPVVDAGTAGSYGGPPLEFIRFDTYHKLHTYRVLAAADSFRQREAEWAAEMTRMNTVLPDDYR